MKVTSVNTGKTFEVVNIHFGQTGNGTFGADVVIEGKPQKASWFIRRTGELSVVVTFRHNDAPAKMDGIASELHSEIAEMVDSRFSQEEINAAKNVYELESQGK